MNTSIKDREAILMSDQADSVVVCNSLEHFGSVTVSVSELVKDIDSLVELLDQAVKYVTACDTPGSNDWLYNYDKLKAGKDE